MTDRLDGLHLTVTLTLEQAERIEALRETSEFSLAEQIGAMIDLDFEEWQDAVHLIKIAAPRSTRWARFVRAGLNT